jgi:hypothetical protein
MEGLGLLLFEIGTLHIDAWIHHWDFTFRVLYIKKMTMEWIIRTNVLLCELGLS